MSELLALQRDFAAALRESAQAPVFLARLAGPAARNADLLAIYRGNAVSNAHAALRLAYPVCEEVLGVECFAQLARLYWHENPASEGDLNLYGASLLECIAARDDFAELPWLPDLARLEWALHEAGMAPDHQPTPFVQLASLSEAELAGTRLQFQPALCLIASSWPIASLWQQHQAEWRALHGEVFQLEDCGAETALVYRDGFKPRVLALPAASADLLVALQAGEMLLPALSACAEKHPDFESQHVLHDIFQRGLVTAILPGEAP
ncbi:DNA-binding domain-containing protein [Uliginosibacterium sp. TH139]|uniref:HvfC/BufC N-terminal domain-containing protein n=1 Tax=Uliginosibacterium sp. TH139 TaxID=2067453 RepID=UPI000C7965B7|nr:DNA-binding domain-containing protein [Uliginosibacterium sp. TH139]PLK50427.1 DUF2063 domain-containing protein [Uliginosibacterium sp. TH139]